MAGCHGSVGVLAMAVSAMDSSDALRFAATGVRLGGLSDVQRNMERKNDETMHKWRMDDTGMVHCLRMSIYGRRSPNSP